MLIFIFEWMLVANFVRISTFAPVAQLDRALACGAKGRRFESCRVYHKSLITMAWLEFLARERGRFELG